MMFNLIVILTISCISLTSSQQAISQGCIGCVCHASSLCDVKFGCQSDVCGPFQMTWGYWVDSGKPTVNGTNPNDPKAFQNCANDLYCSAVAFQGYMQKYEQDCNLDGKITCEDYLAIHKLGGIECGAALPDWYVNRYQKCQNFV